MHLWCNTFKLCIVLAQLLGRKLEARSVNNFFARPVDFCAGLSIVQTVSHLQNEQLERSNRAVGY